MTQHHVLVAVDFFPNQGGISRYVHGLAEGLRQIGQRVTVVAPMGSVLPFDLDPTYALIVDEQSDARLRGGRKMERHDERIRRFLGSIHTHDPIDYLLVMHPFYYGPATVAFARTHGIPSAAFAYGFEVRSQLDADDIDPTSLPYRTRRVYAEADLVFPISEFTANVVEALLGTRREMEVTGCGLFDRELDAGVQRSPVYDPADRRDRRRELGLSTAATVMFVGRLVPSKSVETFIDAISRRSDVEAWVIGDGPQRDVLEQMANDHGVSARIRFFGDVDEERKWSLLSSADALVLPSVELSTGAYEGFGIVLLEASAAGSVALGSRSGGIPDALAGGDAGRLFAPGDPSELAEAIDWVVAEPAAVAATVENARGLLRSRFNWKAIATNVYDCLVHASAVVREESSRRSGSGQSRRDRWLVVTDAFPPNNRGGAEVSLELIVRRLRERNQHIDVAVLDPATRVPQTIAEDAMGSVFRLPFRDGWLPEPHRWPSHRARRIAGLHPVATRLAIGGAYLARRDGSIFRDRARRLWLYRQLRAVGKHGLMPISDVDMVGGTPMRSLGSLLSTRTYTGIHADNYRSIMIASAAVQDLPWSALVRDNRFFCAHPGGDMRIGQDICGHCLFECTSVIDDMDVRSSLVSVMEETIAGRRAGLARASAVAGTSQFLTDGLQQVMPSGREIHRVRSPVEEATYIDVIQAGIQQRQPPQILVVGMVGHNKGTTLLPDFATRLSRVTPEFTLAICGRGHLLDSTMQEAEARGVRSHFAPRGFLGREEMYREYARSSIVLIPAIWPEPFGRVPLESGMSRRPVVAFGTGGLPEVIRHDETGLLVEPGDLDGLVQRVAQLLASPGKRSRMGEEGRRFIAQEFNIDRAADEMEALWRAACDS